MDPQELRRTFVLANEFKEGDLLVGGDARAYQAVFSSCVRVRSRVVSPFEPPGTVLVSSDETLAA